MEKTTKEQLHDKAWDLLEEKGLKLGEKILVRSNFIEWSGYKEEYPFISVKHLKGEEKLYHSEHDLIKNLMFKTKNEVILANAIYENMNEINGQNEFIHIFKFTCRLIGVQTKWNS